MIFPVSGSSSSPIKKEYLKFRLTVKVNYRCQCIRQCYEDGHNVYTKYDQNGLLDVRPWAEWVDDRPIPEGGGLDKFLLKFAHLSIAIAVRVKVDM